MDDWPETREDDPEKDIAAANAALSEWAARSAMESEGLIDRLEAMGYDVRGKSEAEITEILRRPPDRPQA